MDWRAVGAGTSFAMAHLWALALPPLADAHLSSVVLVPTVGVAAGAAAGMASADRHAGTRNGLLAGTVAGLVFAAAFTYVIGTRFEQGAFRALGYLLGAAANAVPAIAANAPVVVPVLGAVGAAVIALAGRWAGGAVAAREELHLLGR
jgi:hypothetical protein